MNTYDISTRDQFLRLDRHSQVECLAQLQEEQADAMVCVRGEYLYDDETPSLYVVCGGNESSSWGAGTPARELIEEFTREG